MPITDYGNIFRHFGAIRKRHLPFAELHNTDAQPLHLRKGIGHE